MKTRGARARGFVRLKTIVYLLIIAAVVVVSYTGFPYASKRFKLKREVVKFANQCLRHDLDRERTIERFMHTVGHDLGFTLYRSDIAVDMEPDRVRVRVKAMVPYEVPLMETRFDEVTVQVDERRIGDG